MTDDATAAHQRELRVTRLMHELEHQIIDLNATRISEMTGGISTEDLQQLGQKIAHLRAQYLQHLIAIARQEEEQISADQLSKLRGYRLSFEELLNGFDALKHALERGYIQIDT